MKEKYKLLEFAIIEKAVAGDFLAMEKVIAYFHRYMIFWAKQNGVLFVHGSSQNSGCSR